MYLSQSFFCHYAKLLFLCPTESSYQEGSHREASISKK